MQLRVIFLHNSPFVHTFLGKTTNGGKKTIFHLVVNFK